MLECGFVARVDDQAGSRVTTTLPGEGATWRYKWLLRAPANAQRLLEGLAQAHGKCTS